MKLLVIVGNLSSPKQNGRSIGIKESGKLSDDVLVPLKGEYAMSYYPDRYSCILKRKLE